MTPEEKKAELERLRVRTGLPRRKFGELYHIGLSAMNEWSRPGSSGPPENVLYLLKRVVEADFPENEAANP